ncbi:MAG: hypothetical protein OYI31_07515 [Chloroflexota bacterium]|nr:hypothetical protein [Chloroflexota bacterium]MDE2942320.1 hypothetical protein [Chloroflexota bacterium]MDE3268276.1 hypothetical protein [Chloroflexota bacterium]
MAYTFRRLFRTPYSEVYSVMDDDQSVGRLDVHVDVAMDTGECSLCVGESLTEDEVRDLMDVVDDEIMGNGFMPSTFNMTVYQGKEIISEVFDLEDDDEDDED